jgi:anti-anti-sigma factor
MSLFPLIQTEACGDVLLLIVNSEVSSLSDQSVLDELEEIRHLRSSIGLRKLVVDLEQAPFFGSSFLEVLRVLWNDVASKNGGEMVICNPSPVGREVLQIAKFDQIWPIVDSRGDALELLCSTNQIASWPDELQRLLALYEQGPTLLRDAVFGLSQIQLRKPAPPGNWSVLQNICHIADFELVYADRMKRVMAEDRPMLLSGDPDEFAANLAYQQRDLDEELDLIAAVRRQVARVLKTKNAADFERVGQHSVDGPLSLRRLLERIAGHIPHHLKFVEAKKGALRGT